MPSPTGGSAYPPPPGAPAPQPSQAYPGAAPSYVPPPAVPAPGHAPQAYGYPAVAQNTPGAAPQGYPGQAYGAGAYPSYPAPRPTSGLAVTSLVCALASLVLSWLVIPVLASVAAVITGHMALSRTKADPSLGGRGMAFAGLIIGYAVLGIGVLVIGIILFSFLMVGAFTLPAVYSS